MSGKESSLSAAKDEMMCQKAGAKQSHMANRTANVRALATSRRGKSDLRAAQSNQLPPKLCAASKPFLSPIPSV